MKPAVFSYEKPESLEELLHLLGESDKDFQVLAGGQSLMPMMNFRLAQPELLIDMNAVAELQFIEASDDSIQIGAMTRYTQLAKSRLVAEHLPLAAMALPHIAHAAVRNRGTIGGSAALADPAAEMPALLLALGASLELASTAGTRQVYADDFFLGIYETALEEREIIKSITIPIKQAGNGFGFYELARRHGDYAMAGAAVATKTLDPISGIKIAMFGVGDRAQRMRGAEQAFEGKALNDTAALAAAIESLNEFEFEGDLNADAATKKHLAGVVLGRALKEMSA